MAYVKHGVTPCKSAILAAYVYVYTCLLTGMDMYDIYVVFNMYKCLVNVPLYIYVYMSGGVRVSCLFLR